MLRRNRANALSLACVLSYANHTYETVGPPTTEFIPLTALERLACRLYARSWTKPWDSEDKTGPGPLGTYISGKQKRITRGKAT